MNWEYRIVKFLRDADNKKTLFLINIMGDHEKIAHFLNKFLYVTSRPHLVVLFNIEIPKSFANGSLNVKLSEDYLLKSDYEDIDNYIFNNLSKSWYLYKYITDYRGITLGKVLEYDLQKYLTPRIKNLEIIRRIIDAENIHQIVVFDDNDELREAARLYADFINLPILIVRYRKLNFRLRLNIKSRLSIFLSDLLDYFAFRRLLKDKEGKGVVLIDARLYNFFRGRKDKMPILPCPLEMGVRIRASLIGQGLSYLPLYFRKSRKYFKEWNVYAQNWKDLCIDNELRNNFRYKGIPIWDIVSPKLSTFFREVIPRIICNINMLTNGVAAEKRIKVAVLRNDVKEFERTLISILRLAKIPSLIIQHGVLAEPNGHNILFADKLVAWGRASIDWYEGLRNFPDKFEIVGNPSFDALLGWRPKISRDELYRKLNLDLNKGIILFVTQQINKFSSFWTNDLFLVMADKLLEAIRQFPTMQLVIKVDPYEDVAPYRNRILKNSHNNAIAVRDFEIYTLIYFSDLVMTLDSTVGLEAMIFDKPLITFNFTKRKDRVPYAEKGAAIGVYHEQDLIFAIKEALTDLEKISQLKSGRAKFLEEYAFKLDGKDRERILNLCRHYVES